MQRKVTELMYGWIHITCVIRKSTLFFLLFMFQITPVHVGFLPLKFAGGAGSEVGCVQ